MNDISYCTCQRMMEYIRKWETEHQGGWPGKALDAPAETRYPNLVAEMDFGIPWLHTAAAFADVSLEIMAAVLEDNETLSLRELYRLADHCDWPVGYLTAPELSIIDPATNKGKARRRQLADLLDQAEPLKYRQWLVDDILACLNAGQAITYASYRWAVNALQSSIYKKKRALCMPRSVRITASS